MLLLLIAACVTFAATGCAPEPEEPVTNPTNEKPADDKAAAGDSGSKESKSDMKVDNMPVTDVNVGSKPPVKDAATLKAEENERKLNPDKPADDAPVKKPHDGRDVPPPGTPVKDGKN